MLAKPGTAVFFDRRLWHAPSPNWSEVTRKVLFYGYGYRWIRTKDDMTVRDLWSHKDLPRWSGAIETIVGPHGVAMYRIDP